MAAARAWLAEICARRSCEAVIEASDEAVDEVVARFNELDEELRSRTGRDGGLGPVEAGISPARARAANLLGSLGS